MTMTKTCLIVVVFSILLCKESTAQSDCTSTLMGLSPCLKYVTGNTSTPSTSCCTQLTGVVKSQPQCLCLLLNGTASSYGFNINQTLALGLPKACNVQTPSASRCTGAAVPKSPSDSSPATGSDIPSGSKATPSPPVVGSGDNVKAPWSAVTLAALVASYAAGFF